jgi:hypothetical protein
VRTSKNAAFVDAVARTQTLKSVNRCASAARCWPTRDRGKIRIVASMYDVVGVVTLV